VDAGRGRRSVSYLHDLAVIRTGLVVRVGEEAVVEVRGPLSISPMISPEPSSCAST